VSEDALHVDLEHPVARPAGLALLALFALTGFAQGIAPKLWSDLSIHQPSPVLAGDNVARPLMEDPTPPVLAIAPKPAPATRPAPKAEQQGEALAQELAAQPAAATAAGADAAALAAPTPAETPPRAPAEIGEPVPALLPVEPAEADAQGAEAPPP
jgi:hypothetical protein